MSHIYFISNDGIEENASNNDHLFILNVDMSHLNIQIINNNIFKIYQLLLSNIE